MDRLASIASVWWHLVCTLARRQRSERPLRLSVEGSREELRVHCRRASDSAWKTLRKLRSTRSVLAQFVRDNAVTKRGGSRGENDGPRGHVVWVHFVG
jgi:hypothetical protein